MKDGKSGKDGRSGKNGKLKTVRWKIWRSGDHFHSYRIWQKNLEGVDLRHSEMKSGKEDGVDLNQMNGNPV